MTVQPSIAAMNFPLSMENEGCFDLVFRTYHQPLVYYAANFVGDDAADLVENLFVKLWQKSPQLQSPQHLKNFLYLATKNACLDFLKTSSHVSNRFEQMAHTIELTEQSHLQTMISAEVLAEVYRAINQLPLQCAKVITMSYVEGKTNSEIAEETGLSMQTVKNHKVRGLKILKDNLSENALILLLTLTYLK